MKKLVLLLFVLPFILFSCSDDIEDSLEDTLWVASGQSGSRQETRNLKFRKSTFTIELWNGNIQDTERTISGTYTYDYPTVIFHYDDTKQEATIHDKNQIRLSDGEGGSYLFIRR